LTAEGGALEAVDSMMEAALTTEVGGEEDLEAEEEGLEVIAVRAGTMITEMFTAVKILRREMTALSVAPTVTFIARVFVRFRPYPSTWRGAFTRGLRGKGECSNPTRTLCDRSWCRTATQHFYPIPQMEFARTFSVRVTPSLKKRK
jgi:hypothetical protein